MRFDAVEAAASQTKTQCIDDESQKLGWDVTSCVEAADVVQHKLRSIEVWMF